MALEGSRVREPLLCERQVALAGLPAPPPRPQEGPGRGRYPRRWHRGPHEGFLQALRALDKEGEALGGGPLHPAFQEEGALAVQELAAPLVGRTEEGRLQQAAFVFYQEKVDPVPALGRGALQALYEACRAGAGAVGEAPDPFARNHPKLPQRHAVRE